MPLTYGQFASQLALRAGPQKIAFTHANAVAIVAWCVGENSPAHCNPLDDTQVMPGSWPLKGNSAHVQNYTDMNEACDAYLRTLAVPSYGYPEIMAELAKGECACLVTQAVARSQWGTWYHNPGASDAMVTKVNANFAQYSAHPIPGS